MSRKRLEEAIIASHNIGIGDYNANINTHYSRSKSDINPHLLNTQRLSLPLDRWGIFSLEYSCNGENLAVGFGNGGIGVINNKSGGLVNEIRHGHRKGLAVMSVNYHKLEKKILMSAGASGVINVWDLHKAKITEPKLSLPEEGNEISALDICSDGNFFATTGKDRHIRIYDATNFTLFHTIPAPDYVTMDEVNVYTGHTKRVFALKFHPTENHMFVTAGWDDSIKVWDKRMPRTAMKSIPGTHVCGAGLDMQNNTILSGSWSAKNALQMWDLRAGNLERIIPYPHDEKSEGEFLYCAKFASANVVVAGGSGTNNACAINTNTNQVLGVVESSKPVLSLDTFNDGDQLSVAGIGGNLQLSSLTF